MADINESASSQNSAPGPEMVEPGMIQEWEMSEGRVTQNANCRLRNSVRSTDSPGRIVPICRISGLKLAIGVREWGSSL